MKAKRGTMKHLMRLGILTSGLILALWSIGAAAHDGKEKSRVQISVKASKPVLVRRITGPIANSINGVPAEPVDSFDWEGREIRAIKGKAQLEIDPVANTGSIKAEWEDEYGYWTYKQKTFAPPHHATGVRIGPSKDTVIMVEDDPVTTNVYLHGNTGVGGPVAPTFFSLLATWGPAKITLNGEPFDNPFPGPTTPMWAGHTIVSEEIRGTDGVVRTTSGEIYHPEHNFEGRVYPDKLNFNLAFHDVSESEMTDNIPPSHRFFYRISFKKVKIKLKYNN
jgi:hypothetical protein